jgi:hypothetical protein
MSQVDRNAEMQRHANRRLCAALLGSRGRTYNIVAERELHDAAFKLESHLANMETLDGGAKPERIANNLLSELSRRAN